MQPTPPPPARSNRWPFFCAGCFALPFALILVANVFNAVVPDTAPTPTPTVVSPPPKQVPATAIPTALSEVEAIAPTPSSLVDFENAQSLGLEYVLAILDAGEPIQRDDLRIKRCRSLLKQLDATYTENQKQIANMTVAAQEQLRAEGINQKLIPIMEGMNTLFIGQKGFQYAEYTAAYITLRNKGQKHDEALQSIRALIRALTKP